MSRADRVLDRLQPLVDWAFVAVIAFSAIAVGALLAGVLWHVLSVAASYVDNWAEAWTILGVIALVLAYAGEIKRNNARQHDNETRLAVIESRVDTLRAEVQALRDAHPYRKR